VPLTGAPVLTVAEMRAAEQAIFDAGTSPYALMVRAGEGAAEIIWRAGHKRDALILCGPGNNGGDGYVIARALRERGVPVRVATTGEPKTESARQARFDWNGPVENIMSAEPAAQLVDAIFGVGQTRLLDTGLAGRLSELIAAAQLSYAIDVPSGVDSDTGAMLGDVPLFDIVLAIGAWKPAHCLMPAMATARRHALVDIGVTALEASARLVAPPHVPAPAPDAHKYSRGMVAVVSGAMHGASELSALSACRAGAGYVLLLTGGLPQPPHAIVRQRFSAEALADGRIGAVVIGPGLGRDERAREKLGAALAGPHSLVIDGDALHLLDLDVLRTREAPAILTPHAGEFAALFGATERSKIERTQEAARRSGAVVVFKGPDSVIAHPDGRANLLGGASPWLSVAGTGDVLAGAIATMLAQKSQNPFEAASAGVWLHAKAAAMLNRCFLADELADALPLALAHAAGSTQ